MPVAGEAAEQQELSNIAVGMQNGPATLENILAVSYKTEYLATTQPSNCTLSCTQSWQGATVFPFFFFEDMNSIREVALNGPEKGKDLGMDIPETGMDSA